MNGRRRGREDRVGEGSTGEGKVREGIMGHGNARSCVERNYRQGLVRERR